MEQSINYANAQKHLVAVDSIVFGFEKDELKILLVKRPVEPEKGTLSLMGGFVQENESVDDAAKRVLLKLTGLSNVFLEQLYSFGNVDRDSGARVISVAYFALIKINDYDKEIVKKNGAEWYRASDCPKLVFDHNQMVDTAIQKLRRKCRTQPIGFELLPQKFTIPQLQSLYEAIFMKELDKRNFRKKMLSMNLLDKLEEKDKDNSKKGAYFYQFNRLKYENLSQLGFSFEL